MAEDAAYWHSNNKLFAITGLKTTMLTLLPNAILQ
jgi:hypothetical protein